MSALTAEQRERKEAMKMLTEKQLNTIRGKALVMKATRAELLAVFAHIDALEARLDESDDMDTFGTEGWRHAFGLED